MPVNQIAALLTFGIGGCLHLGTLIYGVKLYIEARTETLRNTPTT